MKKKSFNLFVLILILTIIASTLAFWKLFLSRKGRVVPTPTPVTTSPTPTSAFEIKPTPVEEIGESAQELVEYLRESFPLYDHLPYTSEKFYLKYKKPFHLKAVLKEDTPEAREEVLNWIRSKGVDPETHEIDWEEKP